jgi:hypothetical protein
MKIDSSAFVLVKRKTPLAREMRSSSVVGVIHRARPAAAGADATTVPSAKAAAAATAAISSGPPPANADGSIKLGATKNKMRFATP